MPRQRSAAPAYQFHISGQAVVRLGSPPKDFYFGAYDSPESHARYHALLGEYNKNGRQQPESPQHQAETAITVHCITAATSLTLTSNCGQKILSALMRFWGTFHECCEFVVFRRNDFASETMIQVGFVCWKSAKNWRYLSLQGCNGCCCLQR